MAIYGYARVSTPDQDLTLQTTALQAVGCDIVRAETVSGSASREQRPELRTLLEFLRTGDTLVVTRVDQLARSMHDLSLITRDLETRGVTLKATEQPIDTSSASGRAFFQMLDIFAEFETNLRREHQAEGIARSSVYRILKDESGGPVAAGP